jgi:hypothetical protein
MYTLNTLRRKRMSSSNRIICGEKRIMCIVFPTDGNFCLSPILEINLWQEGTRQWGIRFQTFVAN